MPAIRPGRLQSIAALLLAIATMAGAMGAHALRGVITDDRLQVFETAVRYQFVHALGLLVLGGYAAREGGAAFAGASHLLLAGIALFCGSLYALALGAPRPLGLITPFGGVALLAGWLVAAAAFWRARQES